MAGADRRRFTRAAAVNVGGNVAKIAIEGMAGLAFGSVALLADAAHSVADLVASLVVFRWGGAAYEAADRSHPHGHQRIEPLTALFVGTTIVLLGLKLLYDSVTGLIAGVDVSFSPILVGAVGFAMADMYLVYRHTDRVNAALDSAALAALARDCLNDIYTSVAVFAGVLGVFLGVPWLDPVAGGLVSLLVVYQGYDVARENVDYLIGAAPPDERREEITEALRTHDGVRGVHDLTVFYDGTVLEVEVHIEVDGSMSLREAHQLETDLVARLREMEGVGDVHVHLDPSGIGEWKEAIDPR